jgi:hypothetical protein
MKEINRDKMTGEEVVKTYRGGRKDFSGANLRGADLRGAYLSEAYLSEANLSGADLCEADLSWADLYRANLREADLYRANLREADLRGANLYRADLSGADLREADLRGANPYRADLSGADLSGANLSGADLSGADLRGTCLDPAAAFDPPTDEELKAAGLEVSEGTTVYGWRTGQSKHCGRTVYAVGQEYTANAFSTSKETECHPGIYLAGLKWLSDNEYPCDVKVSCARKDLIKAGDKFRAKKIFVVERVNSF